LASSDWRVLRGDGSVTPNRRIDVQSSPPTSVEAISALVVCQGSVERASDRPACTRNVHTVDLTDVHHLLTPDRYEPAHSWGEPLEARPLCYALP
jgi:hypothetical protein